MSGKSAAPASRARSKSAGETDCSQKASRESAGVRFQGRCKFLRRRSPDFRKFCGDFFNRRHGAGVFLRCVGFRKEHFFGNGGERLSVVFGMEVQNSGAGRYESSDRFDFVQKAPRPRKAVEQKRRDAVRAFSAFRNGFAPAFRSVYDNRSMQSRGEVQLHGKGRAHRGRDVAGFKSVQSDFADSSPRVGQQFRFERFNVSGKGRRGIRGREIPRVESVETHVAVRANAIGRIADEMPRAFPAGMAVGVGHFFSLISIGTKMSGFSARFNILSAYSSLYQRSVSVLSRRPL